MSAAPLIRLQAAGVRLGPTQALAPLDLVLHRGERLALVGANGSGKTTLLRLLHGLVPHGGQRQLLNLAPEGRAPVLAMLFQKPFLLSLSAQANVRLGPVAARCAACPARPALRPGAGTRQRTVRSDQLPAAVF